MKTYKHMITSIHADGDTLVGVLFHFDTVSKNNTLVRSDAIVRVASDTILRSHLYPEASEFHLNLAGRIQRFYRSEDGKAFLCDFVLFNEADKNAVLSGKLSFSVSWIAEDYDIDTEQNGEVLIFRDITIYETSLVDNPAFATCAGESKDELSCLMNNTNNDEYISDMNKEHTKNSACGCGGKNSVSERKETSQTDYISPMEQEILDAIALLKEEMKALSERVSAIEAKLTSTEAPATSDTEVSEAITEVQSAVAKHEQNLKKIEHEFDMLLKSVSDFVEKAINATKYA